MEPNFTSTETAHRIKILVVEDNPVNQKVIRIILDRGGYQYELAEDGLQAIEKYQNSAYDLVLMDCQMPNLDGLSASTKIRELEAGSKMARCSIIAMTANAMKGDRERCLAAGMDDFLAKPFKSQDLVNIINQWEDKNA